MLWPLSTQGLRTVMNQVEQPTNQEPPRLSIVIPAYNESKRLGVFLPPVLLWLSQQDFSWEMIVVDDGSQDDTAGVAESLDPGGKIRVLRQIPNQGKGAAIRRGMLDAQGDICLFSDADFSTPIEEVPHLLAAMESGADVAFGSRALPESRLEVRQPLFRELSGRWFNFLVRVLLLPGIRDTQCGFKAFNRQAARTVFPRQTLDGFAFDVEVLMLARDAGLKLVEVPVRWINDPASKVSLLRGLQGFADLFRLRLAKRGAHERPEQP